MYSIKGEKGDCWSIKDLKSLEGKVPEVYAVGDCREPLLIVDASADGSRTARTV